MNSEEQILELLAKCTSEQDLDALIQSKSIIRWDTTKILARLTEITQMSHVEIVTKLIPCFGDVNRTFNLSLFKTGDVSLFKRGNAFHMAIVLDSPELFRKLVDEFGWDAAISKLQEKIDGESTLSLACMMGNNRIVKWIIKMCPEQTKDRNTFYVYLFNDMLGNQRPKTKEIIEGFLDNENVIDPLISCGISSYFGGKYMAELYKKVECI